MEKLLPRRCNITTGTIAAYCYDNPQQLFEVQTSGTLTQTDVGSLIDQATYVAGAAINGHSKTEIGGTSQVATAQFKLLRLSEIRVITIQVRQIVTGF